MADEKFKTSVRSSSSWNLEVRASVTTGGEVRREREVFTTSFWQESEAEVQLTVAHEHKRVRAVVGVNAFRVDEAIKLKYTQPQYSYMYI